MGCAPSTVHAYLRDFHQHRAHILYTVFSDNLVDQVHLLTQPQIEPEQHRQTLAASRELRTLLLNLPAILAHDDQQQSTSSDAENANQVWHTEVDALGHRRYITGPKAGQCRLACRTCAREFYASRSANRDDHLDDPGLIEPEPDQSFQFPEESGPIQTNLDNSEHLQDEFPLQDKKLAQIPPNSPPEPQQPNDPTPLRVLKVEVTSTATAPGVPARLPTVTSTPEKGSPCT